MGEQQEQGPEDERQRRVEALRALAGSQTPTPAAAPVSVEPPRRRMGRWLAIGGTLLAVCVIAASVLVWLNLPRTPVQKPIPDPLAIYMNSSSFVTCLGGSTEDVAWSPDGAYLGTIGFTTCGGPENATPTANGYVPSTPDAGGMLGIFNTTTGKLTKTIELDTAVYAHGLLPSITTDPTALQLAFPNVVWSPDGKTVAVTYYAGQVASNGGSQLGGMGLLLVDWASGTIRVLQQPIVQYAQPLNGSIGPLQATLWDLSAGTGQLVSEPQALAYQWASDDSFGPTEVLPALGAPAPTPASGPVGNPIGGRQFTIWQEGSVSFEQQCVVDPQTHEQTCCPITDYLSAEFGSDAAWSPDGQHLLIPLSTLLGAFGRLPAPGAKTVQGACPSGTYGGNLARLPLRDPALSAVLQTLSPPPPFNPNGPPPQFTGPQDAQVAWSPDGRYLAVVTQGNGQAAPVALSVYRTSTAQVTGTITQAPFLAAIPINQRSEFQTANVELLMWSPNGRRLMARDDLDHVMVLFGEKSLGLA